MDYNQIDKFFKEDVITSTWSIFPTMMINSYYQTSKPTSWQ